MATKKTTGKKLADMMYGNPEGAAFGITPMIGKRREDRQDREAAKSFPVDLARGVVAGAAGMPGDIESLIRMLPGLDERTILPTSEDVLKRIPFGTDTPAGQFASGLGILGGGSANIGPAIRGVKAGARGALAAGRAGERMAERALPQIMERGGLGADFLRDLAQGSRSNVIKPKGGNWLGGRLMGNMDENVKRLKPYQKAGAQAGWQQNELERAQASLERLKNDKYTSPMMVEAQQGVVDNLKKRIAVNNWVESNLGKYVKNQMATPEDPIRLLLDKRTKEIEAKHAKDMERAERMAQRAIDEPDPRRQANMIRESERLKMEANVERQFAMDSIIPSRMQDYSPDADQYLKQRRQEAGFPAEGMGESEAAKRYETLTDDAIEFDRAGDLQAALVNQPAFYAVRDQLAAHTNELKAAYKKRLQDNGLSPEEVDVLDRKTPLTEKAYTIGDERYQQLMDEFKSLSGSYTGKDLDAAKQNPFVSKLDPETQLYSGNTADMGFDHVIDILKQDVMEGRIRPEQLSKVSIEDAVRRTMDFDQEAARKMAEAQIKATEGFPIYKEYPEGYRWIELAPPTYTPETLPPGFKLEQWDYKGNPAWSVVDDAGTTYNDAASSPDEALSKFAKSKEGSKALEEALKYEGDTMGHCVGGYCPDVIEGKSRIFSLRDARGEPHVTIEVEPNQHLDYNKWYGEQPTSYKALLNAKKSEPGYDPYQEPAYLAARDAMPPKIVQIKGKQNARPVEKYDKYTQDFVKSGQYSDVGDLENTGLYRADPSELGMFIPSDPRLKNLPGRRTEDFEKAKQAGLFGDQKYFTRDEWEDILRKQIESESGPLPPLEEGMAHGGRVHISDNPDVMALELQAGGLVKKALKAAVKTPQKAVPLVEAPSIFIPSGISSVKEAARQSKGEYGARRIERAADEVKNLEKLYNEKALREVFLGDNAKAVVTMDPADFERYAQILKGRTKDDIGPKMAELAKQGEIDKYTLPMDEYIQHLMRIQGGFDQAPYLNIYKDEVGIPSMPEVRGHEGRHRSRALSEAGESTGLVQISPRGDLREGLPRRSQEEYIEALREELERSGRLVLPEVDGSYRRPAIELPEPYAEGGAVHMQAGGLAKAAKALKAAKEAAVPLTLPRVRPTTQDIMEAAERVGRQQAGEFVKSPLLKKTTNLAGRSKKEVDRLKELEYKLTPIKDLPEMKPYEAKVGEVNIALPGDQTVSDMLLESVDGVPIGTTSEGGALFGRGRLDDPEDKRAFWASNVGPAGAFQRKVTELANLYDTDMVTAYHLAMGQTANNFAQHIADANMRAIDFSKLDKKKMNLFDSEIANGFYKKDNKTGEVVWTQFPEWPGIANPDEALSAMKENPELRKWFNDRMKTEGVTKKSDLPYGKSIEWAMTEPELRNMEINLTGLSAGRMKPGAELIPDSAHQTYSHDIPGTALGRAPELSPFSISFPDATAFVREKYRPQDFTGTIQKVFPHQVVDEAYLDDMYKYYTQLRKVRGFKKGGEVKNQNNEQQVQNPVHFTENPDAMRLELTKRN
jgi:hypothetical protein